jgi:hypothetical protein
MVYSGLEERPITTPAPGINNPESMPGFAPDRDMEM